MAEVVDYPHRIDVDGKVIPLGRPKMYRYPAKPPREHLCDQCRKDRHYGCTCPYGLPWFYRAAIASGDAMIVAGRLVLRPR